MKEVWQSGYKKLKEKAGDNTIYNPRFLKNVQNVAYTAAILSGAITIKKIFDYDNIEMYISYFSTIGLSILGISATSRNIYLSNLLMEMDAIEELNTVISENKKRESPKSRPIYESIDGDVIVEDPGDLLTRLGLKSNESNRKKDYQRVAIRVGTILGHADKRQLHKNEIEKLRMVKAGLSLAPRVGSLVCPLGTEMISRMNNVVYTYESSVGWSNDKK